MGNQTQTIAERLARFSRGVSFRKLSPEVVHEVKRRLIDTLGCALGGWRSQPAKIARKIASRPHLEQGATLLGTSLQTTPDLAAFANGTAIRYLDFNDTYLSREPAHPSDNISTALAAAELSQLGGKKLIEAILIGYETQCRLCDAAALRPRGWDHVTYGAFSTALVAAKLFRLSEQKTIHALGLAGNPNCALRQTRVGALSMWKGAAFANAARNGLFAADLARLGMTGPAPIFEGEKGFMKVVSGNFDLKRFDAEQPSKIMETYIKYYPVEYHAQSAVQAVLNLRSKMPHNFLDDIVSIQVLTSDISYEIIGRDPEKWSPRTRETADHSLPYIVAVAFLDGKVGLPQFNAPHLADPSLHSLTQKIRILPDQKHSEAYPKAIGNTVSVTIGKKTYTECVDYPKGFTENRMTDEEVMEKFRRLASPLLPKEGICEVLDKIWDLEKVKSVGEILMLFGKVKGQ